MMRSATILIADDEQHVTFMLAHKLQRLGATVLVADNGEQGMRLALQRRPDLVITDFQMPVMSGFEMAVQLRQHPETCDVPILMLSARGHRLVPSDLAQTSIRNVIPKPFSMRDVIEQVEQIIGGPPDPEPVIATETDSGADAA